MKLSWINNGVITLLGLLIIVDGALILYARAAGHMEQNPDMMYRFSGKHGAISPPVGFTSKGLKIEPVPRAQSGWAVRYASKGCHYCKEDEPLWGQMLSELKQLGYQVIVVVPSARYEYPDNIVMPTGVEQMIYVNMEWIKRFRLTGTPTLLIFDPNQGLIWSHQGVLSPNDPASAVKAIKHWQEKRVSSVANAISNIQTKNR